MVWDRRGEDMTGQNGKGLEQSSLSAYVILSHLILDVDAAAHTDTDTPHSPDVHMQMWYT